MSPSDMRQRYCDVLMELCEHRRLADIKATDVIREAKTARQTFYNHFFDIDDLICYAASRPLLTGEFPFSDIRNTRKAYAMALEHRAFFSQLPSHVGQNNFQKAYNDWLKRNSYAMFIDKRASKTEQLRRKLAIDLFIVGSTGILMDWYASNMAAPIDLIMEVLLEAAPPFIRNNTGLTPPVLPDYPR